MDNNQQMPIVYPVDPEHAGLRMGVVLIFILLWIVVFSLLNILIPSQGLNILALIASFAVTAILTQQIEKALKTRWPSGRTVQIAPPYVRILKRDQVQHEVDTSQQVNVLLWRFQVRRRSRVPKGWMMVACALEQDDTYIPVYTFMPPNEFENLKGNQHFSLLQSKKELEREGQENMRLAGGQRRLHTAENVRWMEGAEMDRESFKDYIARLQEHFPQWIPAVF